MGRVNKNLTTHKYIDGQTNLEHKNPGCALTTIQIQIMIYPEKVLEDNTAPTNGHVSQFSYSLDQPMGNFCFSRQETPPFLCLDSDVPPPPPHDVLVRGSPSSSHRNGPSSNQIDPSSCTEMVFNEMVFLLNTIESVLEVLNESDELLLL